jgi:Ras GTPase-activating-like protein IQGAP2/3
VINVRDAETQFEIDEFNDLFARTKPTLYIKLGSAKNNENELLHVSSTEITLTLNPKYHEQEG